MTVCVLANIDGAVAMAADGNACFGDEVIGKMNARKILQCGRFAVGIAGASRTAALLTRESFLGVGTPEEFVQALRSEFESEGYGMSPERGIGPAIHGQEFLLASLDSCEAWWVGADSGYTAIEDGEVAAIGCGDVAALGAMHATIMHTKRHEKPRGFNNRAECIVHYGVVVACNVNAYCGGRMSFWNRRRDGKVFYGDPKTGYAARSNLLPD